MALPYPTDVLGKGFRVLTDDEAGDLMLNGRLLYQVVPPKEYFFTDGQLTKMRNGQPLFFILQNKMFMAVYLDRIMKAWEVEILPKPKPTLKERIKQFFKSLKF